MRVLLILSFGSIMTAFISSYCILDEMKKRTNKMLTKKANTIYLITGALFIGLTGVCFYPYIKIIGLILWNLILGKCVFGHKKMTLLYDVFLAICIGICEFPVLFLFSLLITYITISIQGMLWMNLLLMLSSQLFILYFYHIYSRYRFQGRVKLDRSYILLNFVFLPIFSFANIILLMYTLQFYLYPFLLVFIILDIVFIIYLNVYLSYTLQSIFKNAQMKEELSLYEQGKRMQYTYYQKLEEKYEESRKLMHDIKRHMQMVELAKEDHEIITNYRNDLKDYMNTLTMPIYSTNRMLNIILNEKSWEAKKLNIEFDCQITVASLDFIKEIDMTTIFSNLLDNAIDACKEVKTNREIKLYADQIQDFLVMDITNTIKDTPIDNFQSSKKNHEGLGLKNVEQTLEKYGGNMQMEFNKTYFTVHLFIPVV